MYVLKHLLYKTESVRFSLKQSVVKVVIEKSGVFAILLSKPESVK